MIILAENTVAVFELFNKKISEMSPLSAEEIDLARSFFIPKKLRKKQFLLQDGDVCKYQAFVEKGILRSYTVDEKGTEHIVQFAFSGWWISDLYSFYTEEPSSYTIEAIEDSELLILTKSAMEELLTQVPKLERSFRILIQNGYIALQRRIAGNLSLTAEERYNALIKSYPDITEKVPQRMIASFLGLTPETLSRIRKQAIFK